MPGDASASGTRRHIASLDGLRGVAALVVLIYHSAFAAAPFAKGYLAVDFFFCLSGYVIGLAYEKRLGVSLTPGAYLLVRLRRLWPMLFLGAVLGLFTIQFVKPDGYFVPFGRYSLALAFAAQVLLIPFVVSKGAFLLNPPQWSILYELIANAFHGLFSRSLNNAFVLLIIAASAIGLVIIGRVFGYIDFGWGSDNFLLGIPRVGFGFFAGLLLYRTRSRWISRIPDVSFVWLALVLLLALGLPDVPAIGFSGAKREIGVVLLLTPILVALGSASSSRNRATRWLGAMSYPLYAIHGPLLFTALWFQKQISAGPLFLAFADIVIVVLALLTGLFIDQPLNRWRKRARAVPALSV